MRLLILFIATLVSLNAGAKEVAAADCTYLLMSQTELRQSIQRLISTIPPTEAERKALASELRVAANVLLAQTSYGDNDVKNAFQIARELNEGKTSINLLYPLTIAPQPAAKFVTGDLGPLKARFPRLEMVAYPVFRANDLHKPVAYITKMILDVRPADEALFKQLFHHRAFLHESISAGLKEHRQDLLTIASTILGASAKSEMASGRMEAALISPVVTDSFAYAHAEFRNLNREHQSFLTFFAEMKKSPDEIVFEIMHFLGLFTDQADF